MNPSVYCVACGADNPSAAKFCSGCGTAITSSSGRSSFKENTVVEPANYRESTILEGRSFAEKTVLENPGFREATVVEPRGFSEPTRLEKSGGREVTVFEGGPANRQAARQDAGPMPPSHPPGLSGAAGNSFMEPTVFVGGGKSSAPCRLVGWLVTIKGPGGDKDYRVCSGKNTIGRHPHNDVLIADSSISADHAVLWLENGGGTIADLNSRNGILLNGQRVFQPAQLQDGDQLTLGEVSLQLSLFRRREEA